MYIWFIDISKYRRQGKEGCLDRQKMFWKHQVHPFQNRYRIVASTYYLVSYWSTCNEIFVSLKKWAWKIRDTWSNFKGRTIGTYHFKQISIPSKNVTMYLMFFNFLWTDRRQNYLLLLLSPFPCSISAQIGMKTMTDG